MASIVQVPPTSKQTIILPIPANSFSSFDDSRDLPMEFLFVDGFFSVRLAFYFLGERFSVNKIMLN